MVKVKAGSLADRNRRPIIEKQKSVEAKALVKKIKQANLDYHTKGKPTLTDSQYDALKDRLETIDPKNPILKKVGHAPSGRSKKVSLPYHLGSLDKLYIDKVDEIKDLLKTSTTFVVMDKLDGISALNGDSNGKEYLYTRGNGSEGSDISHLIPHVRGVPRLKEKQAVRGELVISKANFKKFSKDFENSRNLVAGIANRTKEIHAAAKVADFVVHESVSPKTPLPRVAAQLERQGAKVVWYKVYREKKLTVTELAKLLKTRLEKSPYEIDGLVVDNLKGKRIAIKGVNETAVATVSHVTWQVSRFGSLTPVVWFATPVRLAGATVKKATGHNAKRIKDDKIGPGAMITIVRSGEVIPKLLDVIKPGKKADFPPAGTYKWDGVNIVSTDESNLDTIKIKQIVSFLTMLGVKSFKDRLVATLFESGLNTISKIVKAPASRIEATGIGPTMSKKLEADLKLAISKTTHPMMMVASNTFGKRFGKTAAKAIYSELGDKIFKMSPTRLQAAVSGIEGVGPVLAELFVKGLPKYQAFIERIGFTPAKAKKTGKKFAGMVFLFTGFRDAKLSAFLEHNGAEIASSLSKKVTHLIVRDKSTSNDKTKKAKELKIKVLTADQVRAL